MQNLQTKKSFGKHDHNSVDQSYVEVLDSLNNVGWGGIGADKDAGSVRRTQPTSQTPESTTA